VLLNGKRQKKKRGGDEKNKQRRKGGEKRRERGKPSAHPEVELMNSGGKTKKKKRGGGSCTKKENVIRLKVEGKGGKTVGIGVTKYQIKVFKTLQGGSDVSCPLTKGTTGNFLMVLGKGVLENGQLKKKYNRWFQGKGKKGVGRQVRRMGQVEVKGTKNTFTIGLNNGKWGVGLKRKKGKIGR